MVDRGPLALPGALSFWGLTPKIGRNLAPVILDAIHSPADLRQLPPEQLPALCAELREFLQQNTDTKEGHIRSSLGVTELSVALHYVLQTPADKLIWDVGHQAYIHKILTGRKERFHTNRKLGGLSGFTSSAESDYDPFGAGHSSTSVSAAVGFARAAALAGDSRQQVAVIGDGALTGGMSFEALNDLGATRLNVLIVINDNRSSIDENVGALAGYTSYQNYFSALGIAYLGDCDGHDVTALVQKFRTAVAESGPRVVRVVTEKGKGRWPQQGSGAKLPGFQEDFAEEVLSLAETDPNLVAITPAMLSGSGLQRLRQKYPERCYDVGIAEQHAVSMAAAMAADGWRPLVHLYATFAQRAYDQIIHDVVLPGLPVVFCLDRAGLAGADGSTHHGAFDVGSLNSLPGIVLAAPLDGGHLRQLMREAFADRRPWFIRYPKDSYTALRPAGTSPVEPVILKSGHGKLVISFGAIGREVHRALEGSALAHADWPVLQAFAKDQALKWAEEFDEIITVEENALRGGLGDTLRAVLSDHQRFTPVSSLGLPDSFVPHGTREELLRMAGLDAASIRTFLGLP